MKNDLVFNTLPHFVFHETIYVELQGFSFQVLTQMIYLPVFWDSFLVALEIKELQPLLNVHLCFFIPTIKTLHLFGMPFIVYPKLFFSFFLFFFHFYLYWLKTFKFLVLNCYIGQLIPFD